MVAGIRKLRKLEVSPQNKLLRDLGNGIKTINLDYFDQKHIKI